MSPPALFQELLLLFCLQFQPIECVASALQEKLTRYLLKHQYPKKPEKLVSHPVFSSPAVFPWEWVRLWSPFSSESGKSGCKGTRLGSGGTEGVMCSKVATYLGSFHGEIWICRGIFGFNQTALV